MKTNKTPTLRFPHFTHAWEKCKAKEILKNVSQKNFPDLPVLSASQEFGMVQRDDIGIDIKYDKKSLSNYKRVQKGQFVIHLRSFQGGLAHCDIEGITSPAYTILDFQEPQEHSSLFWKEIFTSTTFIKRLEAVTYGIRDGRSIGFSDFSELDFFFPTLSEQQRIGSFFKSLDALIALHKRKCENVKELKKALLQKMFVKDGKDVPEIRFGGFNEKWDRVRLGEILEKNSKRNKDLKITNVESVSNKTGFTKQTEQFLDYSVASDDLSNYFVIEPKCFAYNPSRINVGSIAYKSTGDEISVVSPLYVSFFTKDTIDDMFLWSWFKTAEFDRQRGYFSEGGVRDTLSFSQICEIEICFATLAEQTKIGNFFKSLDELIRLYQNQLNSLQNLKKSLLQKMFV